MVDTLEKLKYIAGDQAALQKTAEQKKIAKGQEFHLKSGETISGELSSYEEGTYRVKSKYGVLSIEVKDAASIIFNSNDGIVTVLTEVSPTAQDTDLIRGSVKSIRSGELRVFTEYGDVVVNKLEKLQKISTVEFSKIAIEGFLNRNFLKNPSVESGLDGWVVPDHYQVRSQAPLPKDGSFYFFAGENNIAVAYQNISLQEIARFIDKYELESEIRGYMRDFQDNDISQIVVEFLSEDKTVLDTVNSPQVARSDQWIKFSTKKIIPPGTVFVRFNLKSIRKSGDDNDGYFDALYFGISIPTETN